MAEADEPREVLLEGLPVERFRGAVTYLADVLRECQLVLVGRDQGEETDQALSGLAEGLVPDLEQVRDAFVRGTYELDDQGLLRFRTTLEVAQAATLAHLQMQLVQLRLLGRGGGLLVESDPEVSELLAWIWDEASDQIHGRAPRRHRS
jgi:hypothetical protein